jgi:hypothetical protein
MITKGNSSYGWPEYHSVADDIAKLQRDIEWALDDGDCAPDDISLWERLKRAPKLGKYPKGTYLVALSYHDGEPIEVYNGETATHETIHAVLEQAAESIKEQKAADEWKPVVWRRVDACFETSIRIVEVRVRSGGKYRTWKKLT